MRFFFKTLDLIKGGWHRLLDAVRRMDRRMRAHYHPAWMALLTIAAIAFSMILTIFIPPYIGLSNDGSFDNVLADTGLQRQNTESGEAYFNYYERTYLITPSAAAPDTTPLVMRTVIRLAIRLDLLLTHDAVFDLRSLAAIWLVLYLAVLYPMLVLMLRRVTLYSEGLILCVAAFLVFGDTTIAAQMASFYTLPAQLILLIALTDTVLWLGLRKAVGYALLTLTGCTLLLMNISPYSGIMGVVLSLVAWRVIGEHDPDADPVAVYSHRVLCVILSIVLSTCSIISFVGMDRSQSASQRMNQMTRGVLFQANDPEEALAFFGIDPRYAVLTETYANQQFPVVDPEGGTLDHGFLDRYTTGDVLMYYLLHPGAVIALFDQGVQNAFIARSAYSGNYEQSVGLPARAKALFISVWSTFKEQSAPKTAGTLVVLIVMLLVFHKRNRKDEIADKVWKQELLGRSLFGLLIAAVCLELLTVVLMTGDSELVRESRLMGFFIDILFFYFITEVLHKVRGIDAQEG